MNGGPYYAIFLMGGAANGKTSALQARFQFVPWIEGEPKYEKVRVLIPRARRLDPDDFKQLIPMFSFAVDDAEARKMGVGFGLGGPSGPLNREEYERYRPEIHEGVERRVAEAGFDSLATFVNEWLSEQNPNGEGSNFGGGLTHELSKALAQRFLFRFLAERPPTESFVWDAVGNSVAYLDWIDQALEAGYLVRVFYVQAPLQVAKMWADDRKRKLPTETIVTTYKKAGEAAVSIKRYVDEINDPERLSYERILRGEDCLDEARRRGYTDDELLEV